MFSWISFFQKRPSDKQIRIARIAFGSALLVLIGLSFGHTSFGSNQNPDLTLAFFVLLGLIGLVPLISGLTNFCILRKKQMQRMQMVFGILLVLLGGQMNPILPKETTPTPLAQSGSAVSFDDLAKPIAKPTIPFVGGTWIFLLGFALFIAGLTGKTITSNCLKHGEKITKIRV